MNCSNCGAELPTGQNKFCPHCGKPAAVSNYCANCGLQIQPGSAFCPACGTPQERPATAPPFVPAQPAYLAPPPSSRGTAQGNAGSRPPSKRPPRWGRLAAGLVVVALAVAVFAAPEQWWEGLSGPPAGNPKVVDLGDATFSPPAKDKLVQTKDWGLVPVNQLLVVLKDGLGRKDAEQIAAQLSAKVVGEVAFISFYQLETPSTSESQLTAVAAKARSLQGVELAFPHMLGSSRDGPTPGPTAIPAKPAAQPGAVSGTRCDPLDNAVYRQGGNSRHYEMIGLKAAWDFVRASGAVLSKVHVGVVDEALDTKAGDVQGKSKIYGLRAQDSQTTGYLTHGTEVTNVIGASAGNQGVVGVASMLEDNLEVSVTATQDTSRDSLTLVTPDPKDPTQIDTGWGAYSFKYFVDMQKQIESGATIINASWGAKWVGPWHKDMAATWRKFLLKMNKEHPEVLFVNAAGNGNDAIDGQNDWLSGQNLPNLMTVGGVDPEGHKWAKSDYATGQGEVTLSALSENVVVGVRSSDGKAETESGNSFAAPQVTGAAAILRSLNPKLSAAEIKKILAETAAPGVAGKDKAGNDISVPVPKEVGGRVLRLDNAVLKVINDLRQTKGLPPLERATLEKLSAIDVAATTSNPMEHTIRATVGAVGPAGADISIELQGQGSIGGVARQHINAAGDVTWGFTFMKPTDSVNLIVRRLDTNGCATLSLKPDAVPTPSAIAGGPGTPTTKPAALPATIRGSWAGNATLTAISFPANSRYRFGGKLGEPYLQTLDFLGNAYETGNVIATGQFNFQAPYKYKDGTVTAQSDFKDSGGSGTFRLDARVSPAPGGGYTLEGTIKFTEQEQAGHGEMAGNIKLASPR